MTPPNTPPGKRYFTLGFVGIIVLVASSIAAEEIPDNPTPEKKRQVYLPKPAPSWEEIRRVEKQVPPGYPGGREGWEHRFDRRWDREDDETRKSLEKAYEDMPVDLNEWREWEENIKKADLERRLEKAKELAREERRKWLETPEGQREERERQRVAEREARLRIYDEHWPQGRKIAKTFIKGRNGRSSDLDSEQRIFKRLEIEELIRNREEGRPVFLPPDPENDPFIHAASLSGDEPAEELRKAAHVLEELMPGGRASYDAYGRRYSPDRKTKLPAREHYLAIRNFFLKGSEALDTQALKELQPYLRGMNTPEGFEAAYEFAKKKLGKLGIWLPKAWWEKADVQQPEEKAACSKLASWRERRQKEAIIQKYTAKVMEDNWHRTWADYQPFLSDEAKDLLRFNKDYGWVEKFKRLPVDQQQMVAKLLHDFQTPPDKALLEDAWSAFCALSAGDFVEKVRMSHELNDEAYQRWAQTKALLQYMSTLKQADYNWLERAFVGAAENAPSILLLGGAAWIGNPFLMLAAFATVTVTEVMDIRDAVAITGGNVCGAPFLCRAWGQGALLTLPRFLIALLTLPFWPCKHRRKKRRS